MRGKRAQLRDAVYPMFSCDLGYFRKQFCYELSSALQALGTWERTSASNLDFFFMMVEDLEDEYALPQMV